MTTTLTTRLHDLAARLRAAAVGEYAAEAPVELLIAHRTWLTRRDFLDACTYDFTAPDRHGRPTEMIGIDWAQARYLADNVGCAGSERRILLIAASLAGIDPGESLSELLSSLDEHNIARVLDAIARRAGWHNHRLSHITTGYQPALPAADDPGAEVGALAVVLGALFDQLDETTGILAPPVIGPGDLARHARAVHAALSAAGYRLARDTDR